MFVKKFIEDLKNLMPHGEYFSKNHSKEFMILIKKKYILKPKNDIIFTGNCIVDLVNNYNSNYIRFGDFSFDEKIEIFNGLNVFCQSSYTYLGFNNTSNEILEFDRDDNNFIGYCAESGESFLKSMLIISKFYSDNMMGLINIRGEELEKIKIECAKAAGGTKYLPFFESALW